jgi:hypothetical protein
MGGGGRATVTVSSGDGSVFRILRAAPSSPLISVDGLGVGGAASHTLEVVLSEKAKPGGRHEKLVLHLDHPEQRDLEIGVTVVVRN